LELIASQDHPALVAMVAQFAAQHRETPEQPAEAIAAKDTQAPDETNEQPVEAPIRSESAAARRMREKRARDKEAKLQTA
jgi:pyrrolidone-carboxylate peptidase